MTLRTLLLLSAAIVVACASTDSDAVAPDIASADSLAEVKARPPAAYLLFTDRSVSAQSEAAYEYSIPKIAADIRAGAKPGDVIRVYPLQENTADNTAFYDQTLPALSLSAAESKALESKGLKSKNAAVAKKQRDFDSKINVATGKLVQLSRLPAAGAQNWTDIFGAFALARDLQSSGTGRVDLYMQSDMVHSVRGNDLSKARLRDAATALQLGTDAAIGFRQNASVRDLDWGRLKLHVYFPQSIDDLSAYPSLVRAYWEGFAKAVGMTVVF